MKKSLLLASFALASCGSPAVTPDAPVPVDAPATIDDAPTATDAPIADTWSSYAMGFFATYCIDCHSGPPSGRDFRTITDVIRDAAIIRCGVAPVATPTAGCSGDPAAGTFPIGTGPHPSDADRLRIIAWIDAGLAE